MMSVHKQLIPAETPLVILAEGCFGTHQSKLALGVIRYGQWPVVAVLDSRQAGKTVQAVTGMACDAPIMARLEDALSRQPKALLIGTAPPGGQLPPEWHAVLRHAIQQGLHIINGLHFFLSQEPELVQLAKQYGVLLWDVRDPEAYGPGKFQVINQQLPRAKNIRVITMVGSDCSVGKMHTALELNRAAESQGKTSTFVATGQTGILIAGRGVPLDRVIGDFMAGAMEVCIHEEIAGLPADKSAWIFIEGQGALSHPAYSGVTLSLLHGSNPDVMILCHKADAMGIRNYDLPLPSMSEIIRQYELAASWVRNPHETKARVVGISVNTSALSPVDAEAYIQKLSKETGLPVTDPVRYGVQNLIDAIQAEEGHS